MPRLADKESSERFIKIKASLKSKGNIIADMDIMSISIALSNKFTLVSSNVKHFERIENINLISCL